MTNKEKYLQSKAKAAAANVEGWLEAVERNKKGGIVVTQLYHRPASVIGRPAVKSAARAYADVGRY